jgi:hypothetical protein
MRQTHPDTTAPVAISQLGPLEAKQTILRVYERVAPSMINVTISMAATLHLGYGSRPAAPLNFAYFTHLACFATAL